MQDNERIIELIAKSLDEPLNAQEQALVNQAMQNSIAIRLAAEGLREFDALLSRTGMAIPDEGFPARVIARLEAYEKRRSRTQWLLTVGIFFLGSLATLVWMVSNLQILWEIVWFLVSNIFVIFPFLFALLFTLLRYIGQGPLLLYALMVLILAIVWARASGSWKPLPMKR